MPSKIFLNWISKVHVMCFFRIKFQTFLYLAQSSFDPKISKQENKVIFWCYDDLKVTFRDNLKT